MIAPAVASRKRSFHKLQTFERSISSRQIVKPCGDTSAGSVAQNSDMASAKATKAQPIEQKQSSDSLDSSYLNVPFETRLNPQIGPNSADFVVMEQYFDRQLRKVDLTVSDILKHHFTDSEIQNFIPSRNRTIAEQQECGTKTFKYLLKTTFAGKAPTLPCKMTMLYFGLPVAPMKMDITTTPLEQYLKTLKEEEIDAIPDPLGYLEKRQHVSSNGAENLDVPAMDLRGGSLSEQEVDAILSDIVEVAEDSDDIMSVQWEKEASDQLTMSLRGGKLAYDELPEHTDLDAEAAGREFLYLYGRQGNIGIGATWAEFVRGVVHLLDLGAEQQESQDASIHIGIDLFEGAGQLTKAHLMTQEGLFWLNAAKYDDDPTNKILEFVTTNANKTHDLQTNRRVCFIRLAREARPTNFRPTGPGYLEVVRGDVPESPKAYMRITSLPTRQNAQSQYDEEWRKALRTILPSHPRHYWMDMAFHTASGNRWECGQWYVDQGFPSSLGGHIADHISGPDRFQVIATMNPVDEDVIPILTSPWYTAKEDDDQRGQVQTIAKADIGGMSDITNAVIAHLTDGRFKASGDPYTAKDVQYVELYLPARGFADDSVEPFKCYYQNGRPITHNKQWQQRIDQFHDENKTEFDAGFAIWARPVYKEYVVADHFDPAKCRLSSAMSASFLDSSLDAFRSEVSTNLFQHSFYNPDDDNMVLALTTAGEDMPNNMLIRPDTTDLEWKRMKKMMAFGWIAVNPEYLLADDKHTAEIATRWDVDPDSYWGARYNVGKPPLSILPTPSASTTPSVPLVNPAKGSAPARQQAMWRIPSMFSNPLKPIIPITGGPKESRLKGDSRSLFVTTNGRETTERSHNEDDFHAVRNLALGRVKMCPYKGCGKTYENANQDAFDTHLKEDHLQLKCPYCYANGLSGNQTENGLYFRNKSLALQHFYQYHLNDLLSQNNIDTTQSNVPGPILNNQDRRQILADYKHCNQCGRDHVLCSSPADRDNHQRKCVNLATTSASATKPGSTRLPGYCVHCGEASNGSCTNAKCAGKTTSTNPLPEICCQNCGLEWAGYTPAYQAQHKTGCRPLGGHAWEFCGFCGVSLAVMDYPSRRAHGEFCSKRPKAKTRTCPECSVNLESPKQAHDHFARKHAVGDRCLWCEQAFPAHDRAWTEDVKIQHFAAHMGAHPYVRGVGPGDRVGVNDLKCPGFLECGVVVAHMTSEQYLDHMDQSHGIAMAAGQTHLPNGLPFVTSTKSSKSLRGWKTPGPPPPSTSKGDKFQWKFHSTPRPESPDWSKRMPYKPFTAKKFFPDENLRCSRCFKLAPLVTDPNRDAEIELHCNPALSCRIRRAPGVYNPKDAQVPNTSGWIKFPRGFDFKGARQAFFDAFPAYHGSIFPATDARVDAVYDDPAQARGTPGDDIYSASQRNDALARHQLPWPPHEGQGSYRNIDPDRFDGWHTVPVTLPSSTKTRKSHGKAKSAVVGSASRGDPASILFKVDTDSDSDEGTGHSESSTSDYDEANSWKAGRTSTKRLPRSMRAYDPSYRKLSRDEEPEEEVDDRTNHKDGAAENFSMLIPGMKALPADFRSPLEPGFPRKRSRTPKKDATDDERPLKRARGATYSRESTPIDELTPDIANRSRPAAKDQDKVKATPKPHTKRAMTLGASLPEELATPSTVAVRKSSRAARSTKKVTYTDHAVDDNKDESLASSGTARTKDEKTPARRGRKKASDDNHAEKSAKTPSKPAVKTIAETSAKRTRKKTAQVEDTASSTEALDGPVEDGKRPRRQPRFK